MRYARKKGATRAVVALGSVLAGSGAMAGLMIYGLWQDYAKGGGTSRDVLLLCGLALFGTLFAAVLPARTSTAAMLLLLNLPLVGLWVRLLTIPRRLLYAGILTLASLGAYSVNRSAFHVALTYGIGAAGFAMRRLSMPLAPAVIGLILGPFAEQQLRRSLAIGGSPMIFFTRPISAVLLLFAAGLIVATVIRPRFKT